MPVGDLVYACVALAVVRGHLGCRGANDVGVREMNESQRIVWAEQRNLVVESAVSAMRRAFGRADCVKAGEFQAICETQRIVESERDLPAIFARELRAVVVHHRLDAKAVFTLHAQREVRCAHVAPRTEHTKRGDTGVVGEREQRGLDVILLDGRADERMERPHQNLGAIVLVAFDLDAPQTSFENLDEYLAITHLLFGDERLRQDVAMLTIVSRDLGGHLLQLIDRIAAGRLRLFGRLQDRLRRGDAHTVLGAIHRAGEPEGFHHQLRAFIQTQRPVVHTRNGEEIIRRRHRLHRALHTRKRASRRRGRWHLLRKQRAGAEVSHQRETDQMSESHS